MKTQLETNYKFKEQEQNHNSCGFSSKKRMRMAFVYLPIDWHTSKYFRQRIFKIQN